MPSAQLQKLENNDSPFRQNEITFEALDLFMKSCKQLLMNMEILKHDVDLIKSGKKIIFALDFSEIFTFLYPEKSNSQKRQTVELLLASNTLTFTMLPGTMVELLKSLSRVVNRSKDLRNQVDDLVNKPFARAVFEHLANIKVQTEYESPPLSVSQLNANLNEGRELRKLIQRLQRFLDSPNYVPFEDLMGESQEIAYDEDVFHRCESSLNLYRPGGKDFNNIIDAHNYALAWALSKEHIKTKNTIYMMVTSSPRPFKVYRDIRWDDLRMIVHNPILPVTSLVRHSYQALYLSKTLSETSNQGKILTQVKSSLSTLISEVGKIKEYANRDHQDSKVFSTDLIKLPKNQRFLNAFIRFRDIYGQMFTDVRFAIEGDLIAEENYRWEKSVGDYGINGISSVGQDEAEQLVSTRVLFALFDDITKITLNLIRRNKDVLRKLPDNILREVDIEGIVVAPTKLDIRLKENKDFQSNELIVTKDDRVFLSGDIYPDFYALWWQSNVSFSEFLNASRKYIADVPPELSNEKREKLFNGIYLFFKDTTQPAMMPIEANTELAPEFIHDLIEGRRVQMIRIAGPWGDLCYDFESFRAIPQRIGIVTHCRNLDQLSWFIHRTSKQKTALIEWRRILANILSKRKARKRRRKRT